MTAQEAYEKMIEYSSSQNNCCWYVDGCVKGEEKCYKKEECVFYQAFSKVRKALKILETLEEE